MYMRPDLSRKSDKRDKKAIVHNGKEKRRWNEVMRERMENS